MSAARYRRLFLLAGLCWIATSSAVAQSSTPASADPGLGDLIQRCQADRAYVSSFLGLAWSETRLERLAGVYDEWEERLRSVDFAGLGRQSRLDYLMFRTQLDSERAALELERKRLAELDPLLPFRQPIQSLEFARRRREPVDPEKSAALLAGLIEPISKCRERIEKARQHPETAPSSAPAGPDSPLPVTPVLALRAARAVGDIQHSLNEWAEFHSGYQPDFDWWVRKPREALGNALGDYARYLREDVAGVKGQPNDPLIGDPIGQEALRSQLRREWIAYAPEELLAIGEREFAWCEQQMKAAAAELGCGDDWKAALKKVKDAYVPPGRQDELVLDEARQIVEFLKRDDLLTIPPIVEEMWRVEMLSPETQKSLPYAVYGGQYIGVAYPTDAMSHEDKLASMRGNNRHFLHIVTPHELIPGHHMQAYFAARERPYRGLFHTPFFVEGWAVYWEMKLWERGYARDAADRVGMLFWRMHRCARIIVSLRFHLGKMTPAEMVDFLVDRVGNERFGATSEVRRYIGGDYSPLYQCGYMVGALQIRALHREMVESGKMAEKAFNDALLTYNAIPIEVIRLGLQPTPPTADLTPAWRFCGSADNPTLPHE